MENSIFIARILCIVYLSVGLGLVLNQDYYRSAFIELIDNKGIMFIGGWMALVAGVTMVNYHDIWTNDWRVLITIVGYLALLKGILLFAFPSFINIYKKLFLQTKLLNTLTFLVIGLGILFGYFGFFT